MRADEQVPSGKFWQQHTCSELAACRDTAYMGQAGHLLGNQLLQDLAYFICMTASTVSMQRQLLPTAAAF